MTRYVTSIILFLPLMGCSAGTNLKPSTIDAAGTHSFGRSGNDVATPDIRRSPAKYMCCLGGAWGASSIESSEPAEGNIVPIARVKAPATREVASVPTGLISAKEKGGLNPMFFLQNRGNRRLTVWMMRPSKALCNTLSLRPGEIQTVYACGTYLQWNDSKSSRKLAISSGAAYEIYWDGSGWDIHDVTAERQ